MIKQDIICRCGESVDESTPSDESAVGITQKIGVTGVTKTINKNTANTKGIGTGGTQNTMKTENAGSTKAAAVATNVPKGIHEKLLKLEPLSFYLLHFILILICSN